MAQTLTKPVFLDETGQDIVGKLDDIKQAITDMTGEFIPLLIKVTTPPTKTSYAPGETLDLSGMVVTLIGTNDSAIDVTAGCTFVPANGATLTTESTNVEISYYFARDGVTFTTNLPIDVKELQSIEITTPPTKLAYKEGDLLNLNGIVVTATYVGGSTENVTSRCSFSPANGTALDTDDTSVTATLVSGAVTATDSVSISVKSLDSIAITTPPTKTSYVEQETLDLTGIVVTATYSDSSTEVVTPYCTFSPADGDTLELSDSEIAVTYSEHSITETATQLLEITPIMYGVEWDGSSGSAWTRTDSAADFVDPVPYDDTLENTPSSPFDNIMPWAGMEIVEDPLAGTLVKIPKFWYKWTTNGDSIKLQIAPKATDGFSVSPAHRVDSNTEQDYVYVGRYYSNQINYKSESGKKQASNTKTSWASSIVNLDTTNWSTQPTNYPMYWTLRMLYLVEFADWDIKSKIGTPVGTVNFTQGITDNIPYHTGSAHSGSDVGTQYRHVESLGSPFKTWIGNSTISSGKFKFNIYKATSTSYSYTRTLPTRSGIMKKMRVGTGSAEFALLPEENTDVQSGITGYTCSEFNYDSSGTALCENGAGNLCGISMESSSSNYYARLMKYTS